MVQENQQHPSERRHERGRQRSRYRGSRTKPEQHHRNAERALVIIPTYNEAENIARIIPRVLQQHGRYDVLVVDDNSRDGTGEIVRGITTNNRRVHLIERPSKMGLGTAYVAGFSYALEHGYGFAYEMDADFSHNPKALNALFERTRDCDLVIGSRYLSGVNVVNWPMRRLLLSYFANIYTRVITGLPVHDTTSGFKCYKRAVFASFDLSAIQSNGYAFQIETNYIAWKLGFKVGEVAIVFVDRRSGVSKMSKHIVYEAAWMVWKLKLKNVFLGVPSRKDR